MFTEIEAIQIKDIGVNEWLDSVELAWNENRDPADRMITSFAIKNELPLVTSDQKIKTFYAKTIW
jgi:PIN domain nuclease of toxin-antitoxin system